MKNRRYYIGAALIFLGIIIYMTLDSPATVGTVDNQQVKQVNSIEGVQAFYEKHIPGLKRARNQDFTQSIQEEVDLGGFQQQLTFDEVWYNEDLIFIFYHRDVESIGKGSDESHLEQRREQDIPHIQNFQLTDFQSKDYYDTRHFLGFIPPGSGVQYDDQFYSVMVLSSFRDIGKREKVTKIDDIMKGEITVNVEGENKTFDVSIPIEFNQALQAVEPNEIGTTLSSKDVSIRLEEIQLGISKTVLHLSVQSPRGHLPKLLELSLGKQEQYMLYLEPKDSHPKDNSYDRNTWQAFQVVAPPLPSVPDHLNIHIQSVHLIGNEQATFTYDEDEWTEEERKGKQLFTTNHGTGVVKDYQSSQDGTSISIKYSHKSDTPLPYTTLSEASLPIFDISTHDNDFTLTAESADKDQLELSDVQSGMHHPDHQENPFHGINLVWDRDLSKEAQPITVRMKNLPYKLMLKEKVTVPIQ
ncbi:hypothetical protein ACFFGV_04300 [Pontibacillus salicampi]|uniref:DUF4179 domain-containing protein n=1 Tax=Pontibacillus salicampi TaxID=1449801 RepID=A0ABV6LKH3_9BACI